MHGGTDMRESDSRVVSMDRHLFHERRITWVNGRKGKEREKEGEKEGEKEEEKEVKDVGISDVELSKECDRCGKEPTQAVQG